MCPSGSDPSCDLIRSVSLQRDTSGLSALLMIVWRFLLPGGVVGTLGLFA